MLFEEMVCYVDVVVVFGGDGMLFGIGCYLVGVSVFVIGVNYGWFGFMIDILFDDVYIVLFDMLLGCYEVEMCMLL